MTLDQQLFKAAQEAALGKPNSQFVRDRIKEAFMPIIERAFKEGVAEHANPKLIDVIETPNNPYFPNLVLGPKLNLVPPLDIPLTLNVHI